MSDPDATRAKEIYDCGNFVLVVYDDDRARTVGKQHPDYDFWLGKVNMASQPALPLLDAG